MGTNKTEITIWLPYVSTEAGGSLVLFLSVMMVMAMVHSLARWLLDGCFVIQQPNLNKSNKLFGSLVAT